MNQPLFVVVAGPNGSGKSTLTGGEPDEIRSLPIVDPDAIARRIQVSRPGLSDLAAGKEALETIARYMSEFRSLVIETTLSGKGYLRMMEQARDLGYRVMLVYVGTVDVQINVSRVQDRVIRGGHNVPEADIRRRYQRSLENLPRAVRLAELAVLYDNSESSGYKTIGIAENGIMQWAGEIPEWARTLA